VLQLFGASGIPQFLKPPYSSFHQGRLLFRFSSGRTTTLGIYYYHCWQTTGRSSVTSAWPGELHPGVQVRAPADWRKEVCSARTAAMALCSCAISRRNRMMMRRDGIMPLLARLMKSDSPQLLSPVVGIVKEFAKEVHKET
jgi:hypothetical protein